MYLKRFRGATVRDALADARAALGPHALVLSTGLVQATGWRGLMGAREVEITAAAERAMSAGRTTRQESRHVAPRDAVAAQLRAAGFDAVTAAAVAARAGRRRDGGAARRALSRWVAGLAAGDEPIARVEVFIGPPGAGKTTTVAKLAAQARAARSARLGLIAADGFKVGAADHLRLYADIIGSPFAAVGSAGELRRAIAESDVPVLVDTAGRSPRDGRPRALLAALEGTASVRTHLVLPASASARDVDRIVEAHADARPDRVVLTKVDEAEGAAALAGVLHRRGLRVSYLGVGQRVPEDLVPATPAVLAAALLGEDPIGSGSAA